LKQKRVIVVETAHSVWVSSHNCFVN